VCRTGGSMGFCSVLSHSWYFISLHTQLSYMNLENMLREIRQRSHLVGNSIYLKSPEYANPG
jgi:hypothetical protein